MLIQDEESDTSLDLAQLKERMLGFLGAEYEAFSFWAENRAVGYALCNMAQPPVYLRQFFISREERRKGYGRCAFHGLLKHLGVHTIHIDVYVWNQAGIRFWESLGFQKRSINMRFNAAHQ